MHFAPRRILATAAYLDTEVKGTRPKRDDAISIRPSREWWAVANNGNNFMRYVIIKIEKERKQKIYIL
jgi:hypothetical protein